MNVSPRELDARLRNAGFSNDEVASMREALDAEIGRRFQSLVRHDGLRIVQRLEHQLDQASRGEPRAIGRLEDELFSAGGPTMLARLRRAGAEEEARALDGMMMRGDHEGARRLLAIAAGKMLPIVQEQAELIARGDEGVASHWGGAYRAFETSVQRQSTALGLHPNASASLKDASVLERAVHRSVIQTQARHQEAVETGRAVFDFAMGLAGYSGVAIARGVVERRMETVDAQRRAVSGNATIGSTREVETEEVAATARAIGTAALGSLVSGMVREAIAEAGATELLDEAIDELGDRVHERLSSLLSSRIMIPDPEFTRWLVRKTVEELMSEARGELIPDEAIERALRTTP